MLYVDGMNGVMEHNATVQWLYSLIVNKYRLVTKTALKLLLVFVEYVETNCQLFVKAVEAVDVTQGKPPPFSSSLISTTITTTTIIRLGNHRNNPHHPIRVRLRSCRYHQIIL